MKKLFICFGIILCCFIACRKVPVNNNNNNMPPASGSISGTIQPAGAVTTVTASDTTTGKTYSATPDSSGKFLLSALPPGQYGLAFAVDSSFSPSGLLPSGTNVKSNEVTSLGVLQFAAKPTMVGNSLVLGAVFPKDAFGSISLTSADGQHKYTTAPDAAGNFEFIKVVAGTYTIHFTVIDARLEAPKDSIITIAAYRLFDTRVVYANPKPGYATSKIDTITGEYIDRDVLLGRAPYDSIIVIQGNLHTRNTGNTAALDSALNKITLVTGFLVFEYSSSLQSISMKRLTKTGTLRLTHLPGLTSADFPALKDVDRLEADSTPLLSSIGIPSLQTAGSLNITKTAFPNLDMFKNVSFTPWFGLVIKGNPLLTSISGLHIASDSIGLLFIESNPLLTSLDGLQEIKGVRLKIRIYDNVRLQTLEGLNNIVNTKELYIANNPQLIEICPAKTVINAVKDRPPYVEIIGVLGANPVSITINPFIAVNNGSYVTATDLVNAVVQCP